jgi:hypothetical protein
VKLLLDHCVDRRVAREFSAHEVKTAAEMGWAALNNGRLLEAAASAGFDAVVTVDKNLRHQQNLDELRVSVIALELPDSRLPSLLAVIPQIEAALLLIYRFRFVGIDAHGRMETLGDRT